jgi:hypothetical protein
MGKGWGRVIKLGEAEWHDLRRLVTIPHEEECPHKRLQYMEHGELLLCLDCEKQVSAVWALRYFFTQLERDEEKREARRAAIIADEARLVVHRAALKFQEMVRRKKFMPSCPHCYKPITLEEMQHMGRIRIGYESTPPLPLAMKAQLELVDG